MAEQVTMTDLLAMAAAWANADPDPETRAQIEDLISGGDLTTLDDLFSTELTFGTAGIRGPVGPGPARMNRAVVIRTTHGLSAHVLANGGSLVVVGFDARPDSQRFAEDVVAVLAAAGLRVVRFRDPAPTPLVAFTARHLGSDAAVVITASHNPAGDNGYKVYGANAAQIIPPVDVAIAHLIDTAPPADEVPLAAADNPLVEDVPADIGALYRAQVEGVRPKPVTSELKIVYTALHGCGGETLSRLLYEGGHHGLLPVMEQYLPDGTFPTVAFPNPEEQGALDMAFEAARRANADLVIANDPDADRLAGAVPRDGEWRALTGNEMGCLLGDFVLRNWGVKTRPILVNSIVSSPMLSHLARIHGARHEVTLTGFKWIVNAGLTLEAKGEGVFAYGYEEALGYTIGPVVRDKDGMSAALVFCDLVENLRRDGSTVWDRLEEMWSLVGMWGSGQRSITRSGPEGAASIATMVDRLATTPPTTVAGLTVTAVTDYRVGAESRPPWLGAQDLVEVSFGGAGRALARPSGTEPKLKVYVDLTEELGDDPRSQQDAMTSKALEVGDRLADVMTG
jgi:phosphomannomutase